MLLFEKAEFKRGRTSSYEEDRSGRPTELTSSEIIEGKTTIN